MIDTTSKPLRVILYEGTGAQPLPTAQRVDILGTLLDKGYAVTRAVANGNGNGSANLPSESTLLVLGSFENREPPAAEDAAGAKDLRFEDITGKDGAAILELAESVRGDTPMNQPGKWKPWFPVIDYDRCTNCMQCLSFCLFDVYGVDADNQIEVRNNDNCKTNCPACSRVCPEVAIMFPKYSAGPINGEDVRQEDLDREKMKVDISSLLGGDIYSTLRNRSTDAKSRFSKERDSDKALNERKKCLVKLQQAGDIPPEVLASLPSQEEILKRAEEAKKKAEEALAANERATK